MISFGTNDQKPKNTSIHIALLPFCAMVERGTCGFSFVNRTQQRVRGLPTSSSWYVCLRWWIKGTSKTLLKPLHISMSCYVHKRIEISSTFGTAASKEAVLPLSDMFMGFYCFIDISLCLYFLFSTVFIRRLEDAGKPISSPFNFFCFCLSFDQNFPRYTAL